MKIELGPQQGGWSGNLVSGKDHMAIRRWAAVLPARDLRIGVVGCGYWGSRHVRVLSSLSAVCHVAMIDSNPQAQAPLRCV